MSGATTFRSECKLCDEIFFVPQQGLPYCPRCAKRIGYRYPKPRTEAAARPPVHPPAAEATNQATDPSVVVSAAPPNAAAALNEKLSPGNGAQARSSEPRPADDVRREGKTPPPPRQRPAGTNVGRSNGRPESKGRTPASAGRREKDPQAPGAPLAKVSESLRHSIEHAFEYHAEEPGFRLRDIIERISLEFGVDRQVVHEIVSPLHGANRRTESTQLSLEQRKQITDRYLQMLEEGIRPPMGRRRTLAHDLELTLSAVTVAISHWSWRNHDPRELTRQDKFRLEKAYWRILHEAGAETGRQFSEVVKLVARETDMPHSAVLRWLDQLNDDPRVLKHVPPVDGATREKLEAAYRAYVVEPEPPARSLHSTLAQEYGCTLRQAHRTLLNYRWKERLRLLASTPEQMQMVQACLAPDEIL